MCQQTSLLNSELHRTGTKQFLHPQVRADIWPLVGAQYMFVELKQNRQ